MTQTTEQGTDGAANGAPNLDAHLADLRKYAAFMEKLSVMIEKIHAQATNAGMGPDPLAELSGGREAAQNVASSLEVFTSEVARVNKPVQEARRNSGGQAANNAYLEAGQ